jgi:hypothetical protein
MASYFLALMLGGLSLEENPGASNREPPLV